MSDFKLIFQLSDFGNLLNLLQAISVILQSQLIDLLLQLMNLGVAIFNELVTFAETFCFWGHLRFVLSLQWL